MNTFVINHNYQDCAKSPLLHISEDDLTNGMLAAQSTAEYRIDALIITNAH